MPKVWNMRDTDRPENSVYVGRGQHPMMKWGNPFHIGKDGTRQEVVKKFEEYLLQSSLINDINELQDHDLVCWCAPKGGIEIHDELICHAQVLLRLANENKKKNFS